MAGEITIADLVRNGTMSAEIAATLWAAVDQRVSFLTVALPRFAGKTTTSNAVLALRPADVPLQRVGGEREEMERLKRAGPGGYLVVAEFSNAPVPGYIWGEPVRRVFDTLASGYSLQAALHAPSVEQGMLEVTQGSNVPDAQASAIALVIYIELFGTDFSNYWRRVAQVYEVERVTNGRPQGRDLFRWRRDGDGFERLAQPSRFRLEDEGLRRRAEVIEALAQAGDTAASSVAAAVQSFHAVP